MYWSLLPLLGFLAAVAFAIRGRRLDGQPRCRACEYDVTGIDRICCPECGVDLTPSGAVSQRGRRLRRPLLIAGLLGASASCVALIFESSPDPAPITAIRWAPAWALLLAVDWTDPETRDRIDEDLAKRLAAGGLHIWERASFARRCLNHFLNAANDEVSRALVDSIAPLYDARVFSESELDSIFERCVRITLPEQHIKANTGGQSIYARIEGRLPQSSKKMIDWNRLGSNPRFTVHLGPTEVERIGSSQFDNPLSGTLMAEVRARPGRYRVDSSYSITVEDTSGPVPVTLYTSGGPLRSTVIAD